MKFDEKKLQREKNGFLKQNRSNVFSLKAQKAIDTEKKEVSITNCKTH